MNDSAVATFTTMGERIWFAWKCLPRDSHGDSPDWRELERHVELPNGTLYKLCWGVTTKPQYETIEKAARALGTTPEWLQMERGEGPIARWPVVVRPDPPEGAARRSKHRKRSGTMPAVKVSGK